MLKYILCVYGSNHSSAYENNIGMGGNDKCSLVIYINNHYYEHQP